jgi:hypothetical protein
MLGGPLDDPICDTPTGSDSPIDSDALRATHSEDKLLWMDLALIETLVGSEVAVQLDDPISDTPTGSDSLTDSDALIATTLRKSKLL